MMVERKTIDEGGYVRCDVSVIVTRTKPTNVRPTAVYCCSRRPAAPVQLSRASTTLQATAVNQECELCAASRAVLAHHVIGFCRRGTHIND